MNEQPTIEQLTEQLQSAKADNEDLQRRLATAEDDARRERKSGNQIRGELTRARAEIDRIKREADPDFDPRDGDPCLQMGEGAIPIGHAMGLGMHLEELESVEKLFGLAPTQDAQMRALGIYAQDQAEHALANPRKLLLPAAKDNTGVKFDAREGLRAAALVFWGGRLARFTAKMLAEQLDWLDEDYAEAARQIVCFLAILTNMDFMAFGPVQKEAGRLAKRGATDVDEDTIMQALREVALEAL